LSRPGAWRGAALAVVVALGVAACSGVGRSSPAATGPSPDPGAIRVVATTTVLADLVANVGGTAMAVSSLVPRGGEVHTFDPTPSDIRRVAEADVIVMNGLGLDDWLGDLVADAGSTATVVALGEDLEGVEYIAGGDDGHEGEAVNPHLWMDVAYAAKYVERIVDALATADPAGAAGYRAAGDAYRAQLAELDAWVRDSLAAIPAADRNVVSFHDAFPYYARAYGLTVVDTVVDAPGQDPSAGALADLIAVIRANDIGAILSEAQFSPELVTTIADETGATVVSDLYTDSLGEAPADTFVGIIRWDTERILEALR
jgi:ABC-type Zn uptake system ZnuABC Zn-binding protein ZnuA